VYHTKNHLAQFSEKSNGWWGATIPPEILGKPAPRWSEIADFQPKFARGASDVTHSKKSSIKTNHTSLEESLQQRLFV